MTEVTRVITVEITEVLADGMPVASKNIVRKFYPRMLKHYLRCDDVVVTKIQDFEMEVSDETD